MDKLLTKFLSCFKKRDVYEYTVARIGQMDRVGGTYTEESLREMARLDRDMKYDQGALKVTMKV